MSPLPKKSNKPTSQRNTLKNVALFKEEDEPIIKSPSSQALPIEQIVTSSTQPRRYFDPEKLEQLTEITNRD